MTTRRKIVIISVFIVPLFALWVTKLLILGGANQVTLQSADPLVGRISQALTSTDRVGLPIAGRDYTLKNTKYFDNNGWVVVSVKGKNNTITDGLFVLKQTNGVYSVVLGPGTSFPSSATVAMPTDVQQYLKDGGYLYDTVAQ